jgi:glycopeptide antibiotics resistance protein
MLTDVPPLLVFAFVGLLIALVFLKWRGKSYGYLLCFTLFTVYMWAFVGYTVFAFGINLTLTDEYRWDAFGYVHWIPSIFEGEFDIRSEQVYDHVLLGMPFGFALPFVVDTTPKRVFWLGLALGFAPELLEILQNAFFEGVPRSVDIDDVWIVFVGVLSGYCILRAIAYVYHRLGWTSVARIPVWDHFHNVLLGVASTKKPASPAHPASRVLPA